MIPNSWLFGALVVVPVLTAAFIIGASLTYLLLPLIRRIRRH